LQNPPGIDGAAQEFFDIILPIAVTSVKVHSVAHERGSIPLQCGPRFGQGATSFHSIPIRRYKCRQVPVQFKKPHIHKA
jgi:hypothetical protein